MALARGSAEIGDEGKEGISNPIACKGLGVALSRTTVQARLQQWRGVVTF